MLLYDFFGSVLALNRKQNVTCRNSASKWGKFTLIWIHLSSQFCFPLHISIPWMFLWVPGVAPVSYHLHINQRVLALLPWCQDWPCCWLHSGLQCCSQGTATGFPSPGIFPGLCRGALAMCELISYSRRAAWSQVNVDMMDVGLVKLSFPHTGTALFTSVVSGYVALS